MIYVLATIVLLGHVALFVAVVNRFHGFVVSRRRLKILDAVWTVLACGIPLAMGAWFLQGVLRDGDLAASKWCFPICTYASVCIVSAIVATIHRAIYSYNASLVTDRLVSNHTEVICLQSRLGYRPTGRITTWLSMLPGNEILKVAVHQKQLRVRRLHPALHGLTITHLSDLHLTGQMKKEFYREIVDQSMKLQSDMVVITGDIVEKKDCLPWIYEIFSRLRAPMGVYYVLGNHEKRINDEIAVRKALDSAGMVGLGSRCVAVASNDQTILLAGTEMPWYPPSPDMNSHVASECDPDCLRILLSHSPDQLSWAQSQGFDLMLAGHTHGGQVRLPFLGPVLSPSLSGIRYAAGTFDCEPTLLHVSRGISGTRPLRLNCPPEIAQLHLHCDPSM